MSLCDLVPESLSWPWAHTPAQFDWGASLPVPVFSPNGIRGTVVALPGLLGRRRHPTPGQTIFLQARVKC